MRSILFEMQWFDMVNLYIFIIFMFLIFFRPV